MGCMEEEEEAEARRCVGMSVYNVYRMGWEWQVGGIVAGERVVRYGGG